MTFCEYVFTFEKTSRKSSPFSQKSVNCCRTSIAFSTSNAGGGADGSSQTTSMSSSSWIASPHTSTKISASVGLSPFVDSSALISNETAAFSYSGTSSGNLSRNSLMVSSCSSAASPLNGSS